MKRRDFLKSAMLAAAASSELPKYAWTQQKNKDPKPEDVRRAFWWFSSVTLISVLPTLKRT